MIGWMQKHKKYLVITIWVSTIAFVGAGFVGWGAYSFSSSANAVAIVGKTKIPLQKMQYEYNRLYGIYNQLVGGTLDQEQAEQMGIKEQALNNLIAQTLMLNYAYDLGLRVSQEEIVNEISTMQPFLNQGQFDEKIYKQILQENQLRPKDFEENIKESLLLQKLGKLLDLPLTNLEIDLLKNAYFIEDLTHIKILNKDDISFNPTQEAIQKYWQENQDIYQTERGYEIQSIVVLPDEIPLDEENLKKHYEDFKNQFLDANGQLIPYDKAKEKVIESYKNAQAEKQALKDYIALRRGENPKALSQKILESDEQYGMDFINALSQAKEEETLKPIKTQAGFITAKIIKIIPSQPKTYEEAKADATRDYIELEKMKKLEENAKAQIKDFKNNEGVNLGYVSRDTQATIQGLTREESADFIRQLFSQKESLGYIILANKAILYKISYQRLKKSDIIAKNLDFLIQNGTQIKTRLTEQSFLDYLTSFYLIEKKL